MDASVHASLVIVFAWLVKLAFNAVGIDVGEDVYTSLAGVIVAYILSLFGLSLWVRGTANSTALRGNGPQYVPPFTR